MRYRMLNHPEVIETINREVIPVRYNITKSGFPHGVPALGRWAQDYTRNPWTRMVYGHYVLVSADGERAYGCSRCQCVEIMLERNPFGHAFADLKELIVRAKRERDLMARSAGSDQGAEAELAELHRMMAGDILDRSLCVTDLRLLTARFLNNWGAGAWEEILRVLDADEVEPGVRNAAIHALGDFLTNDAPFEPKAERHLKAIYQLLDPSEAEGLFNAVSQVAKPEINRLGIAHFPLPPSLRRIAARSLGRLVGEAWNADDPNLIYRARAWWLQHKDDGVWSYEIIAASAAKDSATVIGSRSQD